ncbi:Hsp70-like protein [Verticillium alfalfae VaMs.102]|uniref:Hsp70-like protein n=1 Tax=Verticillium alfalfae (strain VaMs.102 / ATCC MYA-4576 / FGSC 10136) TaxID=526221 RepID=C9SLP1_VERA1|nr:Hsp70-like protein [Verticillium alfalfae VaMs.102]EEY19609.1 Hsp70-like protein [Verticillium alfalfae VaMs.102]
MDFEKLAISERKIIVGIDFGTTYSGVAWAETQRPDRRTTITTWPVSKTIREGESSDKVPTKLRYSKGDVQWGFSIPVTAPQNEVVEWFKLDIDPTLQDMGNTVAKEARAGRSFCVTVPAIWSDLAKDKTRQACQKAPGLVATRSPIHLVSEPEAAAIYALHGLDPHGLQAGDTIVVVDAGGGTVDLISYTITRLKPILEVQEAAPGSGALCGSTFLNLRFRKFLTSKLGSEEGFDDEVLAEALDVFEKKFTMQAGPGDTFIVPVGGLANNKELGISRGRFSLKLADLQTIFEPVILECIKLVSAQIAASGVPISAVLLVGGFGASNYLKERIRNAIDRKIQILQPPNAWQAVVQGAVMKGLAQASPSQLTQVRIQNRRARKHYGTQWRTRYEERQHGHLRDKRHWCGLDGCYKVYTMEYMVRRGDAVSETDAYYVSFVWTGLVSQGRIKKVKMDIYADGTSSVAPVARNDNTKLLCHVEADVSHIPESQLDRRQGNDGEAYYELECKIEARFHSASTEYTLLYNSKWSLQRRVDDFELTPPDQRYNTVTAEYV